MSAHHPSVDAPDLHAEVGRRLEAAGQRYTSPRRRLVTLLQGISRPHASGELLELDPRLAQSSLYRNLSVLEEAGVVVRLASSDDTARFELAEDVTGHHHHHLVCVACGTVDDVEFGSALERTLLSAEQAARDEHGFVAIDHRIEIRGTCRRCL